MSKGSKRRPAQVPHKKVMEEWERIFGVPRGTVGKPIKVDTNRFENGDTVLFCPKCEMLARALCREYNRGFEDGTDDHPYGSALSDEAQNQYLDSVVEKEWRDFVDMANDLKRQLLDIITI